MSLALTAEFREIDAADAMTRLDTLGGEVACAAEQSDRTPQAHALACRQIIGAAHGFLGDRENYDDPRNSMLDLVLTRRRGLPILLSGVYVSKSLAEPRFQRCPVGHHWSLVTPVRESELTEEPRRLAQSHKDIRLP